MRNGMSEHEHQQATENKKEWRMANVTLAAALANEHWHRAKAAQSALRDALDSRNASPIERAQRDVDALEKALAEIHAALTEALVMGLN